MNDSSRSNVSFAEVFTTMFRRLSCEELNTVYPARIVKYDRLKMSADLELLVTREYSDKTVLKYPIIVDVPVIMPRTATSFIKLPVKIGDTVIAIFSKSSLDEYLLNGVTSKVSPKEQFRLTDAFAIVGMFPFGKGCPSEDDESLEIINGAQSIKVKADGNIELGKGALKSLVTETFKELYNTHTHSVTVDPTTGAGATTGLTLGSMTDADLTSKVKAI